LKGETKAIEHSASRESELNPLLKWIDGLGNRLASFEPISFHAPSRRVDLSESEFVSKLELIADRGWAIIVHPDVIEDFSCWKSLGRAVCIENMSYVNSSCRDERLKRESTDAFSRLSHISADSTVVILETPVLESEVSEEISRAAQIFRSRLVHGFLDIPMNEDEQKVLAGRD